MNTQTVRAGAHIEGIHWVAEYAETMHEIRIFREGQEVDVHNAPSTLFGDEENAGSKSCADHRAAEAAVLAYLRHFVAEHHSCGPGCSFRYSRATALYPYPVGSSKESRPSPAAAAPDP